MTTWRKRGRVATALLLAGGHLAACASGVESSAEVVSVAVAANFTAAHAELSALFESATGFRIETSSGSSGQLYAQIRNGAPFQVFLSADGERPQTLEQEGLAVAGTRFTYAHGRLALYGPTFDPVRPRGVDLAEGGYTHLAIANPETAPYGAAALEALSALGLREYTSQKLVNGESVIQALQFVVTGGAELGFVALAQLRDAPSNHYWVVPERLHRPIGQEAVLLLEGAEHEGARSFLDFLKGPEATAVMRAHGYEPPRAGA